MNAPKDELAGLRRYLERLRKSVITRDGKDVTKEEISFVEREIKSLESAIARNKASS